MKTANRHLSEFKNLKVLVTGSTGFKGAWLSNWLNILGSKVTGVGLPPEKNSILFKELNLEKKIQQYYFDITNFNKFNNLIKKTKPDIIFHLAAQSIVSQSYLNPLETFRSNIIGSANVLETFRINRIPSLVYITSDKCYLNLDKNRSYKETDRLGGLDNYSSSKASAEILFYSFFNSYFKSNKKLSLGSARAGNVIGGGDFKENRIIPDFFKSIKNKKKLILRNPNATRPWQHVLEPLSGYLKLSDLLLNKKINSKIYPSWNFGPYKKNCKKVIEMVDMFYKHTNIKKNLKILKKSNFKESSLLSLNIEKAKREITWEPRLSVKECVQLTSDWYTSYYSGMDTEKITNDQIEYYLSK